MIDVLLVLIIIFMVITPLRPRGLDTLLPQPAAGAQSPAAPAGQIVVTLLPGGQMLLNREVVDGAALAARLAGLFRHGARQPVFIRGERGLEFREVAQVIDLARGAGVDRVGLMTQ